MKHSNISIFVPHIGCPNMCSFCNQHTISGTQKAPTAEKVMAVCTQALGEVRSPENAEIAFFGGSFTAIPQDYMVSLLETASEFVGKGKFRGIRISTRPDCIDTQILCILRKYGVTSIELGAQSMVNHVLESNDRGHTAEDVFRACRLIRAEGFELGLQMMMGLYKSTESDEYETFEKIIYIKPDTVRIYPVVILKNTRLGELYKSGEYKTFSFDEVVNMVSAFLTSFEKNGINVIKCGLHASEFVENDMVGGFYHPAFREICESRIYRDKISQILARKTGKNRDFSFAVSPTCISKAVGQCRANINYFREKFSGCNVKIIGDIGVKKYDVELRG
ncbi:MAG: radical SAM protein [Ruminococcus sp.]|nr:radical SAM protein [Ruminococcus sp.]